MDFANINGLRLRLRVDELMDQPGLDPAAHELALQGLGRINALSRSDSIVWPPIARLARTSALKVRVLDLACGGGDVTSALTLRSKKAGMNVHVDGCDVSETAVALANLRPGLASFTCLDVLRDPLPEGYDVICCSLFLHHLEVEDAVTLLGKMARAARRLVLVNDLARSRFGYALAWAGCRLLSRSYIVRHDGPASVAAAFTPAEARDLAARAGLIGATVERRWPERFLLSWSKP